MADLYIANTSKQDHDFVFDVPGGKRHHLRKIQAGGQIVLTNLEGDTIKTIIDHHAMYGMRDIKAIKNEKIFVGLCYSDHEITFDGLTSAIEHNMKNLEEEGDMLRTAASIAADQSLINQAPETSELRRTEVQIEQVATKNNPDTEINETRRISTEKGAPVDRRGKRTQGGPK